MGITRAPLHAAASDVTADQHHARDHAGSHGDGQTDSLAAGHVRVARFGLGVTPQPTLSAVADAAGGLTMDNAARVAINAWLERARQLGFIAP